MSKRLVIINGPEAIVDKRSRLMIVEQRISSLDGEDIYKKDAKKIDKFLRSSIPSGTYNELAIILSKHSGVMKHIKLALGK